MWKKNFKFAERFINNKVGSKLNAALRGKQLWFVYTHNFREKMFVKIKFR